MRDESDNSNDNQKKVDEIPPKPDLERVKAVLPLWEFLRKLIHLNKNSEKNKKVNDEIASKEKNHVEEPKKPKPGCKF